MPDHKPATASQQDNAAPTSTDPNSSDPDSERNAAPQYKLALKKALDLLARRDHAAQEIQQKLFNRGFKPAIIDAVLEYLYAQNYLNDRRFAESFARMRVEKGYGERDIQARLLQRGITKPDINAALNHLETDWLECAIRELEKKLRQLDTADKASLRQRGARFLQARGFSTEQTLNALDSVQLGVTGDE